MSERRNGLPWLYLLLDGIGSLLVVAGILPLVGIDFGQPALRSAAPFLIGIGIVLMIPFIGWAIGRARDQAR
ncbi:MAG: hypothetical protein R3348_00140 [Xanthomonadales bacterium]|nr:hypothetical protein [Xanthomonadales bacterium]